MSAWLKALPWGRAPLRFLCNASSSANRRQLGLIHTQTHIRKSLNCPKREVELLSIVFSLNPSSLNPHISTCTSWDSSALQRFHFRIALLTWINSLEIWGVCEQSAALLTCFCLCASSIKRGVFAGPFFKEREFDLISHAGVSLFTSEHTGLFFITTLWISNASTQERHTQGSIS